MLKRRDIPFAIAIANFLAIFAALIWLYPWPSYPSEHQYARNQKEGYSNSSNRPPFTSHEWATDNRQQQNDKEAISDWWTVRIAGLSLVVAFFQLLFFWWQLGAMRRGLIDTATAATAAARQAGVAQNTFEKLERPYLYVTGVRNFEVDSASKGNITPYIRYTVANYGKLPARITQVAIRNCSARGNVPDIAAIADAADDLVGNPIFAPQEARTVRSEPCIGMQWHFFDKWEYPSRPAAVPTNMGDDEDYFFYIAISYNGPFTKGHTTTACWHWNDGIGAFELLPEPASLNQMT